MKTIDPGLSSLLTVEGRGAKYTIDVPPDAFRNAFRGDDKVKERVLSVVRKTELSDPGSFTKLARENNASDRVSKHEFVRRSTGLPKDYLDFTDQYVDRSTLLSAIEPGQALPGIRRFLLVRHLQLVSRMDPERAEVIDLWLEMLDEREIPSSFIENVKPMLNWKTANSHAESLLAISEEVNPAFNTVNDAFRPDFSFKVPRITWSPANRGRQMMEHRFKCRESLIEEITRFRRHQFHR